MSEQLIKAVGERSGVRWLRSDDGSTGAHCLFTHNNTRAAAYSERRERVRGGNQPFCYIAVTQWLYAAAKLGRAALTQKVASRAEWPCIYVYVAICIITSTRPTPS
jgi:hypothetical protein